MKPIAIHWQIFIGILGGILVGLVCVQFTGGREFVIDWIKPFGTIFITLLKLIAIPLIIVSLIKGDSDLKDVTQLSRLGIRTFGLYVLTTVIAVSIGIGLVNFIEPGNFISEDTRQEMLQSFDGEVQEKVDEATEIKEERGPLQILVDIVPDNIFKATASNSNMLQVIFFSLLVGVSMIMIPPYRIELLKTLTNSANAIVLKVVDL